jgi:hypothetical protein
VLAQGQPLPPEGHHPAEPGPSFGHELITGHERILRAQPVRHDPQPVQGGLVQVRPLQATDQLQRVHPGHGQDIRVGVTPGCDREHRMGHRAEHLGDDRLVKQLGLPAVRLDLTRLPPFVLPQQARRGGQLDLGVSARVDRGVGAHRLDRIGLAPAARLPLVQHPPGPCGPVIGHQGLTPPSRWSCLQCHPCQGW